MPNSSRETKFLRRERGQGNNYFPWLATSIIGNLTRLILTICVTIHTCIHTYRRYFQHAYFSYVGVAKKRRIFTAVHGDLSRQHPFGITLRFTGPAVQVDSRQLLLLFLTFSVLVINPKKLLHTVASTARGLLNKQKRTK